MLPRPHEIINRKMYILLGFICILLITGCASQKTWKYGIEPVAISPVIIDKSVSVPPFSDQRLNENNNMFAMYLIPLMPFGWQNYNTPEGAQMHMNSGIWFWRPNEDIAKAAAEELNASHIFKEVFFTYRESDAPLVLKGTIQSTKYNGKLISYGLSAYGPLLWIVGFPATSISNELIISFKLVDKTKNIVLWKKDYEQKLNRLNWLYFMRSDFEYSDMLKDILLDVANDIRSNIDSIRAATISISMREFDRNWVTSYIPPGI